DRAALGQRSLPFTFNDYLELLDWTARQRRAGKHAMSSRAPPIFERFNIDPNAFVLAMRPSGNVFGRALGTLERLRSHAQALGQAWVKGLQQSRRLYRATCPADYAAHSRERKEVTVSGTPNSAPPGERPA